MINTLLNKLFNINNQISLTTDSNDILDEKTIFIAHYTNKNIFNQKLFYSETFNLNNRNKDNYLECLNCETKMSKPKNGEEWHCKTCNVAYSSFGNVLILHSNTPLNKNDNSLITIIEKFPSNTKTEYKNKNTVSSCCASRVVPSNIIPNLSINIREFKCPCCSSEYEKPDHGDTWICNTCETEFISYGNLLKYTDSKIYLIKLKLANFNDDMPLITRKKV
jgi:ribosomal protein L37AE/L43A